MVTYLFVLMDGPDPIGIFKTYDGARDFVMRLEYSEKEMDGRFVIEQVRFLND